MSALHLVIIEFIIESYNNIKFYNIRQQHKRLRVIKGRHHAPVACMCPSTQRILQPVSCAVWVMHWEY